MTKAPRAICLLSGGMDSAVAAAAAKSEGFDLYCLFVDYGQRTRAKELSCAQALARHLGAREMRSTRLDWLGQAAPSPLTTEGPELTVDRPELIYVPFRNSILLSLAVAWAEATGATDVFLGITGPPWAVPDSSPEFVEAFQQLVHVASRAGERLRVRAPLAPLRKAEVVRKGVELKVPFERTWSCQNFEEAACGTCTSCVDRLGAFGEAGLQDSIPYRAEGLGVRVS